MPITRIPSRATPSSAGSTRWKRLRRSCRSSSASLAQTPEARRGLTGEQWVRQVLQVLEDRGWSWTAWDLHPSAGPRLISDWKYTPTPSFGTWVKQALLGTLPRETLSSARGRGHRVAAASSAAIGIFENHGDVGTVLHPGLGRLRPDRSRATRSPAVARTCGRRGTRFITCGRR